MKDEFRAEIPLDEEDEDRVLVLEDELDPELEEDDEVAPEFEEDDVLEDEDELLLVPVLEDDDDAIFRKGKNRLATPAIVTAAPTANARPYTVAPSLMVIDAAA